MDDKIVLDALRTANKFGAEGQEVIGFLWPSSATNDHKILLITTVSKTKTASEME